MTPSSSILLNHVDPVTQLPQVPDWTAIGPAAEADSGLSTVQMTNVSGRISGVAVDPTNPNRIFVTAASGGIWRTLDGGANWTPLTDHLPATTNTLPTNTPLTDAERTLNMGAIAIAPSNPNVIYAAEGEADTGSTGFGVLVSTDGGNTWALTGTDVFNGISAHSIVVDNLNPNIAFVAVNTPIFPPGFPPGIGGIYRTLNGGATWQNITTQSSLFQPTPSLGTVTAFSDVDLVPRTSVSQPLEVYAAVGEQEGDPRNGIYRSVDAGDPTAGNVTWNLQIGGSAFLPGSGPGNIQLAISPTLPSTMYASIADAANPVTGDQVLLGVYKTTDGGVNWQRLGTPPNYLPNFLGTQGGYDNVVVVSPTNANEFVLAGVGSGAEQSTGAVLLSTDGGNSFTDITTANGTSPHTDDHAGAFDSNGNFLLGCDGGFFKYTFGTTPKWSSLNGTGTSNPTVTALDTIQFYSVALNPTDANLALGGSQDNGTGRFDDNIGWTQTDGGDGEKVIYDFDNPLHALHIIPLASGGTADYVEITDDGGLTWTPYAGGIGNLTGPATIQPSTLIIDPSDSNRYFIGTDEISISQDGGVTWGNMYTFAPGATQTVPSDPSSNIAPSMGGPIPITALALGRASAAADLPMFLASHVDGTIYQLFLPPPPNPAPTTMDWFNIAANAPGGAFVASKIIVDPQNPENAYFMGTDGNGKFDILRTQDLNELVDTGNLPTFTDITGNLPPDLNQLQSAQILDSAMALDPKNFSDPTDDVLYVAGRSGQIYQLVNPGGSNFTWTRVGNPYNSTTGKGMPDVDVTDLELNTTTGILAAGTYGAGMWEIQVRGLIRGQVFLDSNGDGKLDNNEGGIAGVTVILLNADNGLQIANTTTDSGGFYVFRSLTASQLTATNYEIEEVTPAGDIQTTPTLTLTNLSEQSTYDISDPYLNSSAVAIGDFAPGSISGTKFNDLNGNGVKDAGEPGVGGFQIYIDSNNDGVYEAGEPTTTTAADGSFSFTNLGPAVINGLPNPVTYNGTYIIREVQQSGWSQTTAPLPAIILNSGQSVTGQLIGNMRTASIAGSVYVDTNGDGVRESGEPGESGVTVDLSGPGGMRTVVSAADGSFSILSLAPGTYTLTEQVPAGYAQTTPNPAPIVLATGSNLSGFAFGNFQDVTLSGSKFNDLNGNGVQDKGEPGLAGFVFDLVNASTSAVVATATSSATGAFSFTGVGPLPGGGNYLIREVQQTGWTQTTSNPAAFAPSSGVNQTSFLFGNFKQYSVAGVAYIDVNGDGSEDGADHGAPGFVVQLLNSSNTVVAHATTAADGTFSLPNLGPGTFTLVEQPKNGYTISQGSAGYAIAGQSATNVAGENFGNVSHSVIVTGTDAGEPPDVVVRNAATQAVIGSFDAYTAAFTGGVRVATGYFQDSAMPDIVTAPGPGGGPHIRVFNPDGQVIAQFFAYSASFTGGVYVAVGDVNGDGVPDIITGAGAGGGPHVEVFDGASLLKGQVKVLYSFYAYTPNFTGGVRVAAGNIDGDGDADIITAAGPGGGPHVEVFSGQTGQLIRSFFAYSASFTGGVYVAAGDINGDGISDIITGPGIGAPDLRVFNGATNGTLLKSGYGFPPTSPGQVNSVWTSGLRVATVDLNQDGVADIIVAPGADEAPNIRVLNGLTLTDLLPGGELGVYDPSFLGGVYVGGG